MILVMRNFVGRPLAPLLVGLALLLPALLTVGNSRAEGLSLSEEQWDWLATHPEIKVGPDPTFAPIEYFDENGEFSGIAADYLHLLEKKLGIKFRIERLADWDTSVEMAKNRQIDVWTAAVKTPRRSEYMSFTAPYLNVPAVIMVRNDLKRGKTLELDDLYGLRIGVVSKYAAQEFISNAYPDLPLIEMQSVEAGLQELSFGEIDVFIGNIATAVRYAKSAGIGNIMVAGDTGFSYQWSLASRSDWPILAGILQAGLEATTEAEIREITDRWISLHKREPLWTGEFIFQLISIAFLLFVIGLLFWTRSLHRLVTQRTKNLEKELTARRTFEEEIQKQKNLMDEVGSLGIIGGWELDTTTDKLTWSKTTYEIHERPKDFVPSVEAVANAYPPKAQEELLQAVMVCIDTGKPFDLELPLVTAKGNKKWVRTRGRRHQNEDGRVRIYGALQDVTYRREVQEDLQRSKEDLAVQLQEAEYSHSELEKQAATLVELADQQKLLADKAEMGERAKAEFLATMSHEIRTPLTGILGMADLLLLGDLTLDQRKKAQTIKNSGEMLLTILNDILDQSKLDSGKFELSNADVYLPDLIQGTLDLLTDKAAENNLSIDYKPSPELPAGINIDPVRLRQILSNLLSNAIKFSADGTITLKVLPEAREQDQMLRFTVSDQGIGISEEHQQRLFQRFEQADAATARQYGGSGLGLSICKQLVELMGGEIGVDSVVGEGSDFWFTLPLVPASTEMTPGYLPTPLALPRHGQAYNVLVAEDNAVNQALISALLEKAGHSVTVVDNGRKAVDAVLDGNFDLLLMDVRMPVLGGTEATMEIRASDSPKATIPVIALTADAMAENIQEYMDAGMNAVEMKPVNLPKLLRTIHTVMEVSCPAPEAVAELPGNAQGLPVGDTGKMTELRELLDESTLRDLLEQAPESLKKSVDELKVGVISGNHEAIRAAAHAIKGMSISLCAPRLSEEATVFEKMHAQPEEIKGLLPGFDDTVEQTLAWWQSVLKSNVVVLRKNAL